MGLIITLTLPVLLVGFVWHSLVFAFVVGKGLFETILEKS